MGDVWFGTRKKMRWVPAWLASPDYNKKSYSEQADYLNGGAGLRNSTSSHMEYLLTWGATARTAIRPIADYADGIYGDGLVYFCDPFAMDQNILPSQWASPAVGGKDGVPLAGDVRPKLIDNPDMSLDYPAQMARYTLQAGTVCRNVWIPIPPGYTAWVGATGDLASTANVTATPTVGEVVTGLPVVLPMLAVSSPVRFSNSFDGGEGAGIQIALAYPTGGTGDKTITLAGLMVQILPFGTPATTGPFVSGQGHSGCEFVGKPTPMPYSAALDKVGLSAKLTETGDWK